MGSECLVGVNAMDWKTLSRKGRRWLRRDAELSCPDLVDPEKEDNCPELSEGWISQQTRGVYPSHTEPNSAYWTGKRMHSVWDNAAGSWDGLFE